MDEENEQAQDALPVSETSAHNLAEDPGDGSVARCTCGWVAEFAPTWGKTAAYARYLERAEAHIAHARALEHAQRDTEARHKAEVREAYISAAPLTAFTIQLGNPWLLEEIREQGKAWEMLQRKTTTAPIVPLEHQPRRGDAIEAWLKRELVKYAPGEVGPETDIAHATVSYLLETYQQSADASEPFRAVVQEN